VHDNVVISPRFRAIAGGDLAILLLSSLGPVVSAQADSSMVGFGTRQAVALENHGDVLTGGDNVSCQLGRPAGNRSATPGLVLRNIKGVAAAAAHTLALGVDVKVYAWGGDAPTLGNNDDNEPCEGPERVASLVAKTIAHIGYGDRLQPGRDDERRAVLHGCERSGTMSSGRAVRALSRVCRVPNCRARWPPWVPAHSTRWCRQRTDGSMPSALHATDSSAGAVPRAY
jgi:hypothetical protein